MARFRAGQGDRPFFDFNHNDDEASGHPIEFRWAGGDLKTGGVRCKTDWTPDAEDAIKKKKYLRFSPQFIPDDASGEVIGMPVNMGGLVNRAAFKSIQPVGAKAQTQSKKSMDESEMQAAVAAKDQEITKLNLRIAELEASDTVKAKDAEIATLKTKITTLETAAATQAKENAKAIVAGYVSAGKIPPQDAAKITAFETFYLHDPVNCKAVLEALPANPALVTIVRNAGGAQQVVPPQQTGEDEFIVKAREYGEMNKIAKPLEAQAQFAQTAQGKKLYDAYTRKLRKGQ
jgi:hypothetical protein